MIYLSNISKQEIFKMDNQSITGIIYKTTNLINGKIYVGQTIREKKDNYYGSGF